MNIFKKYYIYILEFICGNIIFNFMYTLIKIITLNSIGATNEDFIENIINSFTETFIIYIIIYISIVIIQVLYDKYIVDSLNNKLNKTKKGGDRNE